MNTALRVFVCAFSFVFTALFTTVVLSAVFACFAGALDQGCQPSLRTGMTFLPVLLGVVAGVRSASASYRLEVARQQRAAERRSSSPNW